MRPQNTLTPDVRCKKIPQDAKSGRETYETQSLVHSKKRKGKNVRIKIELYNMKASHLREGNFLEHSRNPKKTI